jgi:hypothetical protein
MPLQPGATLLVVLAERKPDCFTAAALAEESVFVLGRGLPHDGGRGQPQSLIEPFGRFRSRRQLPLLGQRYMPLWRRP